MIATAGVVLLSVTALLFVLWRGQRRLIYLPDIVPPPAVERALPGAHEVEFETADGLRLAGWWLQPAEAPPRGTVLVLPGNAGDRGDRAPLAARLAERRFAVLLVDYRGYGGNPARPDEEGLAADARAARRWVIEQSGVDARRLIYFGESLGSGVAVRLAAEHPPALLVLRSPFTSLVDTARVHYPWLPVGTLLRDRFDSLRRIGELSMPLLVVAGNRDRIVPLEQSRRLYEASGSPQRRLVVIEDAGHNDFALLVGDEMLDAFENMWEQTESP